mmetsp:Transcript_10648/g.23063  ORF Transcript_10648/g.23063 Transcript_10648/m.23063 type:complete len:203 (+) Transcript_10648:98-706(+)
MIVSSQPKSTYQQYITHQQVNNNLQPKNLNLKRNENILDDVQSSIAGLDIKLLVLDLGETELATRGIVLHFHSHGVLRRRHGHHDGNFVTLEQGGNGSLLMSLLRKSAKDDRLVGNVIEKDVGNELLEAFLGTTGELSQDTSNVTESTFLIVPAGIEFVRVVIDKVAQLLGKTEEGIVPGSKYGNVCQTTVTRFAKTALETG